MGTCNGNTHSKAVKIRRRTALGLLVSSWVFWLPRIRAQERKIEARDLARVSVLADTIVPRDEFPGAVDAGVPQRIINTFSRDVQKCADYARGLELLDELANRGHGATFANLDVDNREQLLQSLAKGDSFSRRFQYVAVNDVLTSYYSSSAGQQMLGYQPPSNGYGPPPAFCA